MVVIARLSVGGAEAHTRSLINGLSDEFRIVFVTLKPGVPPIGNVSADRLASWEQLDIGTGINIDATRMLAELIDRHRVDVVLCANPYPLAYAHLARLRSKRCPRLIGVFHSTVLRTWREWLDMVVYRPFFWFSECLVYVCEAQKLYWQRRLLWSRSVNVIYNGVDLDHFDAGRLGVDFHDLRRSYGLESTDRVAGICAALRPEKAHLDLLEALARQHGKGRRWKLLIIGDGEMRPAIEEACRRLHIVSHVHMVGALSDVRPAVMCCDVMVLPSTSVETFSMSALESMALGKPMILSDTGGAREQIDSGHSGLIFEAGNSAELAECLERCWSPETTKRLGAAALAAVKERFSEPAMLDKYRVLLRRQLALAQNQ